MVACGVMGVLAWRFGAAPFVDGLRRVDASSLAAAGGIGAVTTLCCAWRWTLVARGLGAAVSLRSAVAACYLSQFLNVATPGGVLGDVNRGVRHGNVVGDVSRGLRSVVWERFAGQVVLIAIAVCLLSAMPSPVRGLLPVVGGVVLAGAAAFAIVALTVPSRLTAAWARTIRGATTDLRAGVLARQSWPGIVLASAVAVAGHVLTFLVATRSAGQGASLAQVLPLALLVLVAMGLPNIAGWGPREGMAAWAFGVGGLGAEQGVAVAVTYGVMVFVATLPGAALLLTTLLRRRAVWVVGRGSSRVAAGSADGRFHD